MHSEGYKRQYKKVKSIKLNKSALTLYAGTKVTLKVAISPNDANNKKLRWVSSNTKAAIVNEDGRVMAKSKGTAKVRVEAADGSGKFAECTVHVLNRNSAFNINRKKTTLFNGKSIQLKCISSKRTITDVKWKSLNTKELKNLINNFVVDKLVLFICVMAILSTLR